jgi:hypothetical protein
VVSRVGSRVTLAGQPAWPLRTTTGCRSASQPSVLVLLEHVTAPPRIPFAELGLDIG